MIGVRFRGHPDLRRILMYPEFEGHPLRKDYPADKTQPLVAYRTEEEAGLPLDKLAPFGPTRACPSAALAAAAGDRQQGKLTDGTAWISISKKASSSSPRSRCTSTWGRRIPAMHGTVRIVLELSGETIVKADVQIGYLHRGFEKMCERGTWTQVFPYVDR